MTPGKPLPTPQEILPLVKADLDERIALGAAEYGSPLSTASVNDSLRYAYEQALDLALYLKQELMRRARA